MSRARADAWDFFQAPFVAQPSPVSPPLPLCSMPTSSPSSLGRPPASKQLPDPTLLAQIPANRTQHRAQICLQPWGSCSITLPPPPPRTLRCRAGVQPCASSSPSAPAAKLQVTSAESPPLPARRHPSDDAAALYIAWGGSASGCGAGPAAVPMPGAPYGAGAVHSA